MENGVSKTTIEYWKKDSVEHHTRYDIDLNTQDGKLALLDFINGLQSLPFSGRRIDFALTINSKMTAFLFIYN